MEIFEKAFGILQMDDGTELIYDGEFLDPRSFNDPNDIIGLISPEFIIHSKLATITFTDAQNIRLFMGHNKMLLEIKTKEQEKIKEQILDLWNVIDGYRYQMERIRNPGDQMMAMHRTSIEQLECRIKDLRTALY